MNHREPFREHLVPCDCSSCYLRFTYNAEEDKRYELWGTLFKAICWSRTDRLRDRLREALKAAWAIGRGREYVEYELILDRDAVWSLRNFLTSTLLPAPGQIGRWRSTGSGQDKKPSG